MNANLELIRDLYNQIEDLKAKLEAEKEVLLADGPLYRRHGVAGDRSR